MKKLFLLSFVFLIGLSILVSATDTPRFPDQLNKTERGRHSPMGVKSLEALAGNISYLSIYTEAVTQAWQGYIGNISGTIVLDDANNRTLYDWALPNPSGEVYATRSNSINWSTGNIICANNSVITNEELALNINNAEDMDSINRTFNMTFSGDIYVATNHITAASNCRQANLYVSDAWENSGIFKEILLYDIANNKTIYTAIIHKGYAVGYDGNTYNFQLIVPEDGHYGDTSTTTYYFYVEIQ
ncbi:MAG: hypothetical protein ACP5OZ_05160 [Candidatus Woesearchaeota archaeon]